MEVYFVRHGKTKWNELGLFQGRADIELADSGIAEAKETADSVKKTGLSFDRVYSSPLQRSLKTAMIISSYPKDRIITDERLYEMDFGIMDGTDYYKPDYPGCEKAERPFGGFFDDPCGYIPPLGAESFLDFRKRTDSFLNELTVLSQKDDAPENVLVSSHGWVTRMLFLSMCDIPLESVRQIKVPNGKLFHFSFIDGKYIKDPDPF